MARWCGLGHVVLEHNVPGEEVGKQCDETLKAWQPFENAGVLPVLGEPFFVVIHGDGGNNESIEAHTPQPFFRNWHDQLRAGLDCIRLAQPKHFGWGSQESRGFREKDSFYLFYKSARVYSVWSTVYR